MLKKAFPSMLALAAALAVAAPAAAQVRGAAHVGVHSGHHWHGHHHHGFWGGLGIGIVLWPGFYADERAGPIEVMPAPSAPPGPPEPSITPRGGQSGAQTEADRQACDREAMTQPSAMADAAVFHRTALACMERRGYAVGGPR